LTAGRGCQEHKHNQYNARKMRLHSRTPKWRNDRPVRKHSNITQLRLTPWPAS
jgi:hypothetical protein